MYKKEIFAKSEKDTIRVGRCLAEIAKRGDFFALYGTLGVGKSVLARAFIQKFCGNIEVPSPTFTLLQSYETDGFDLYHFDLYRIKSPEEIFEIGMEEAIYNGVLLVEWPEKMGNYIPKDVFKIEISTENDGRKITIHCNSSEKQERLSMLEL